MSHLSLSVTFFIVLAPIAAFGQAIPGSRSHAQQWPTPVRQVSHAENLEVIELPPAAVPMNSLRSIHAPGHQHVVIQSPQQSTSRKARHGKHHPAARNHPKLLLHRRSIQPPPATLPEAQLSQSWKAPYSYGYFGASTTRHWSQHFGYRDRYTEWRLR